MLARNAGRDEGRVDVTSSVRSIPRGPDSQMNCACQEQQTSTTHSLCSSRRAINQTNLWPGTSKTVNVMEPTRGE